MTADGLYAAADPLVWIAALYAGGFALIVLELFIPGWIAGTAGAAALGLAVYLAWRDVSTLLAAVLAAGGAAGIPFLVRWGVGRVALKNTLSVEAGYGPPRAEGIEACAGKRGVAATLLRPSGGVEVDGRRYDARSESGVLPAGTPVIVTRVEGTELIVRRAP